MKNYLALFLLLIIPGAISHAGSKYSTRLFLNSNPIQVYFNDGDTFHYQSNGKRISARLMGYNTLESFGYVHQWGEWTPEELFEIAKHATREAQEGEWHCTSEGQADKYGRQLVSCPDLAEHLISRGLAHVMLLDPQSVSPHILSQAQAIQSEVGFWKKGVPAYLLTSVHSANEAGLEQGAYDRVVSTQTGHSFVITHSHTYSLCQNISHSLGSLGNSSVMIYLPANQRFTKTNPCLSN